MELARGGNARFGPIAARSSPRGPQAVGTVAPNIDLWPVRALDPISAERAYYDE